MNLSNYLLYYFVFSKKSHSLKYSKRIIINKH